MILGRVVGTVWASRKDARLEGRKLLLVRPYGSYELTHDSDLLVAVDTLGAGPGEDVVVSLGWPARASLESNTLPVDAAVTAIVDSCQLDRAAATSRAFSFAGATPRTLEWIES